MRLWWGVAGCVATIAAGCGEAVPPSVLHGGATGYLLRLDQLASPDFRVDTAAHRLTAADIAGSDAAAAAQLDAAGFLAGAGEEFFRMDGSLADANGPVQVRDTVEELSSASGAAAVFDADITRLDAVAGATAVSTGALGDAAHATTRSATSASGTRAVEVTVEWRVDNLIDVIVVRGREGGTRLDDALVLAHRQTVSELGLTTPHAGTPATPSRS